MVYNQTAIYIYKQEDAAMITISDIAVLAETSTATVSRVLNADPHVAPGTRQRILQVIATTGYKPRSSSKTDSKKKNSILICA